MKTGKYVKGKDRKIASIIVISTDCITELNNVINAGAKLVKDKIGIYQKNLNKNTKVGWEMRLKGEIKKLRQ